MAGFQENMTDYSPVPVLRCTFDQLLYMLDLKKLHTHNNLDRQVTTNITEFYVKGGMLFVIRNGIPL